MSFNVAVVGSGAVGKSAMTIQFVQHVFCEEYDPTIEDQYRKQVVIDDCCSILEIIDTAGQEEYKVMHDQHLRVGDGFLIVFALNSKYSFEECKKYYEHIQKVKETKLIAVVLAGNKKDLVNEIEVPECVIREYTNANKLPYFETSAKTRENIEESFFEVARQIKRLNKDLLPKKKSRFCGLL